MTKDTRVIASLHRLTRLESCVERSAYVGRRFSSISSLLYRSGKRRREKMEESRASGNRATFAALPRLFGDSCANLFRARNPICLRLIVLLPRPLLRSVVALSLSLFATMELVVEGIVPRIIATLQ